MSGCKACCTWSETGGGCVDFVDVALHRDRRRSIAPFQDWIFLNNFDMSDLAQRHQLTAVILQDQVSELGRIQPVGAGAAGYDLNRSDILADACYGHPSQQNLQLLCDITGRQADQSQAVLVDRETYRRSAFRSNRY